MIPEKATTLTMEYTVYYEIHIDDDINRDEIKSMWVMWGHLMIEMNDGTVHELDGTDNIVESIDWKRGHRNLRWVDDNYEPVDEEVDA